jgi:hypothetical protein
VSASPHVELLTHTVDLLHIVAGARDARVPIKFHGDVGHLVGTDALEVRMDDAAGNRAIGAGVARAALSAACEAGVDLVQEQSAASELDESDGRLATIGDSTRDQPVDPCVADDHRLGCARPPSHVYVRHTAS